MSITISFRTKPKTVADTAVAGVYNDNTLSSAAIQLDRDLDGMIGDYLKMHGFDVTLCDGGPSLRAEVEKTRPDLVVLDVMMPRMDGIEVTRRMRDDARARCAPHGSVDAGRGDRCSPSIDLRQDDHHCTARPAPDSRKAHSSSGSWLPATTGSWAFRAS